LMSFRSTHCPPEGKMSLFKCLLAHTHDLRLELSRHQASAEEWENFNAECWRFLATAAQLPTPPAPARNLTDPVQAPCVTDGLIERQRIDPSGRKPNCGALSFSYLQFKVIEALQPHPAYEIDDGFQPLGVIQRMTFAGDRKAKTALSELRRAGFSLLDIVDDLVAKGMVVKTEYEPCNGDVMVGLAANLPMREAAHVERKKLIRTIASSIALCCTGTRMEQVLSLRPQVIWSNQAVRFGRSYPAFIQSKIASQIAPNH
jgi:hypothetical protein